MDSIKSNIGEIYQIISDLNKNKSDTDYSKISNLVQDKLNQLVEQLSNHHAIPLSLKNQIEDLMGFVREKFDSHFKENAINEIGVKILGVYQALEVSNSKADESRKIGLKISLILDVDCPDDNGACIESFENTIKEELPFIISQSALKGNGIVDPKLSLSENLTMQNLFIEKASEWDFYQLNNSDEYILFIPKSLLPEKQGHEKLEALDLNVSQLKAVTVNEILKGEPSKDKNIDRIFSFFVEEPKLNKVFEISGHGSEQVIAALKGDNYDKMFSFLEKQKCKAVVLNSCYLGGKPSLRNTSKETTKDSSIGFYQQPKDNTFLTLINSIGEFGTYPYPSKKIIDGLSSYLEGESQTINQLRVVLEKAEVDAPKKMTNDAKVYFPHSAGIPSGFRPIGERGRGYSITYTSEKQSSLLRQESRLADQSLKLEIKNKDHLDVHPLVVSTPLLFQGKDPLLISMIPGDAHHFFSQIQSVRNLSDFLDTLETQKSPYSVKCYLIEKMNTPKNNLEEVIVFIDKGRIDCYYKENNQYFLYRKPPTPITPFQFALFCQNAIQRSKSVEEALRVSSSGQENENMFTDAVNTSQFGTSTNKETNELLSLVNGDQEVNKTKILNLAHSLTNNEKKDFAFYLLEKGMKDLALTFIQNEKIDTNAVDLKGTPLICMAIKEKAESLTNYLIQNHINLDVIDPNNLNLTPLHLLVKNNNKSILEEIIKNSTSLNLEVKDISGLTPIWHAFQNENLEIAKLLLFRGASIDHLSNFGVSFLGVNIYFPSSDAGKKIDFLLNAGADPNIGNPSALLLAIDSQDANLVKKLLENGGKAFSRDSSGSVPFIQALLRGTPEIVKLLLDAKDCNLNVTDKQGLSPLIAALYKENNEVLALLAKKNISLPSSLKEVPLEVLKTTFLRLYKKNDSEGLKQLLAWKQSSCLAFENFVFEYLGANDPDRLADCIRWGFIDPNQMSNSDADDIISFFEHIIDYANSGNPEDFDRFENLIIACLENGANTVEALYDSIMSPLFQASLNQNNRLVKVLLEYTNDFSEYEDPHKLLNDIIDAGDVELIKLACQKLGTFPLSPQEASPLYIAARNLKTLTPSSIEIFKYMLENGNGDINFVFENRSILSYVAQTGNLELMEYCFTKGAKLESRDDALSPMEVAAFLGNDPEGKILKFLLEKGGTLNDPCKSNHASLFAVLVAYGSWELIEWGLKNGAQINVPGSEENQTPLMYAALRKDHLDVFKLLIKEKGGIKEEDYSAVFQAISNGDLEFLEFVFANGANFDTAELQGNAMMAVIVSGNLEVMEFLIGKNYEIDMTLLEKTPLIVEGYEAGGEKMIKRIFERFPKLVIFPPIVEKLWSSIIEKNDLPSAVLLLAYVKAFSLTKPKSISAIILNDREALLNLLLEQGLKKETVIQGRTNLFGWALVNPKGPSNKIIQILLNSGDSPEQIIHHNGLHYPIYLAVEKGDIELVRMLVKAGVEKSKNEKDPSSHQSALELAKEKGDQEIINLLQTVA